MFNTLLVSLHHTSASTMPSDGSIVLVSISMNVRAKTESQAAEGKREEGIHNRRCEESEKKVNTHSSKRVIGKTSTKETFCLKII